MIASGTGWPSPSSTLPSIVKRSPDIPGPASLSVRRRSNPMLKKGPTVCEVVAGVFALIFHGGGVAASENDVELIAERRFRNRSFPVEKGNHAFARFFIGDAVEYGIERKQGITGEIHLRNEARRESRAEKRKMNVGRSPSIVVIAPGI